jgi:hypothetical protein
VRDQEGREGLPDNPALFVKQGERGVVQGRAIRAVRRTGGRCCRATGRRELVAIHCGNCTKEKPVCPPNVPGFSCAGRANARAASAANRS